MTEWLTQQAQSASPFVAVFCLLVSALAVRVVRVLWQEIKIKDQQNREIAHESNAALTAAAVAIEKGANATSSLALEIREGRRRSR